MSFDPRENRRQREQQKARQKKKPRLNPPFPFRPTPFDPWYFGVEKDPPRTKISR